MELLEADSFVLQSFDTATGLKFFLTADPESKHLDQVRRGSWSAPAGRLFVVAVTTCTTFMRGRGGWEVRGE